MYVAYIPLLKVGVGVADTIICVIDCSSGIEVLDVWRKVFCNVDAVPNKMMDT